jgi:hypothetical protein
MLLTLVATAMAAPAQTDVPSLLGGEGICRGGCASDCVKACQSGRRQRWACHGQPTNATIIPPNGAKILELVGHMVIPGVVGLHEHLGYTIVSRYAPLRNPVLLQFESAFSAPRVFCKRCNIHTNSRYD